MVRIGFLVLDKVRDNLMWAKNFTETLFTSENGAGKWPGVSMVFAKTG